MLREKPNLRERMSNWLEYFWGEILSRDAERTCRAFNAIEDPEEKQAVRDHLQKMATEEGWAEPQRISAQHALDSLKD